MMAILMRGKTHNVLVRVSAGVALSIATVSAQSPTTAPSGTPIAVTIDGVVNRALNGGRAAGVAVGISDSGRIVYTKGYGKANLEHDVAVTGDTVFRVGSLTKQFTAVSILLLAEQQGLSVSDKLSAYYPDFPRGDEITLRHLLNHTSGLHNYTASGTPYRTAARIDHTTSEFVEYIKKQKPLFDFDPGTKYSYNNTGYFLLGGIVEQVSGMSLRDFMRQRIFEPLGMYRTALDDAADIVTERASGYDRAPEKPGNFRNASFVSMTVPGGAGALRSTVGDLLKWQSALLDGQVVAPPASFAEMTTPGRLNNGELARSDVFVGLGATGGPTVADAAGPNYGFGLITATLDGQDVIYHGGAINGFSATVLTYVRQRITVVVLANTGGVAAELAPTIARAYLRK